MGCPCRGAVLKRPVLKTVHRKRPSGMPLLYTPVTPHYWIGDIESKFHVPMRVVGRSSGVNCKLAPQPLLKRIGDRFPTFLSKRRLANRVRKLSRSRHRSRLVNPRSRRGRPCRAGSSRTNGTLASNVGPQGQKGCSSFLGFEKPRACLMLRDECVHGRGEQLTPNWSTCRKYQ